MKASFYYDSDLTWPIAEINRSIDHSSPARDKLCKRQNTNTFTLSTEIGMKWSGSGYSTQELRTLLNKSDSQFYVWKF